jgi:putative addiction module killer protein
MMEAFERELEAYVTEEGRAPFLYWLDALRDAPGRAKIRTRLDRVRLGNFGDCAGIGDGVEELRIDFGPGYRVYFGQVSSNVVLLLCGGDKSTQAKDVQKAQIYWKNYKRRSSRRGDK